MENLLAAQEGQFAASHGHPSKEKMVRSLHWHLMKRGSPQHSLYSTHSCPSLHSFWHWRMQTVQVSCPGGVTSAGEVVVGAMVGVRVGAAVGPEV